MTKALVFLGLYLVSLISNAAIVSIGINGSLGDPVISLHADYEGAPISGNFEIELADRLVHLSNGNPYYELTSWSITITGSNGSSLLLASSSEVYDYGILLLDQSSNLMSITWDEDIDNPATGAIEDTTLRLYFDPLFNITSDTAFEDLSSFQFVTSSLLPSSFLQFSTSQVSMSVASASITTVSLPSAAWLFGSVLLGLGVVKRKKA